MKKNKISEVFIVLEEEVQKIIDNQTALDIYTNPKKFTDWFVNNVAIRIEQDDLEDEVVFDEIIKFIGVKITANYMGVSERHIKNTYFNKK